MTTVLHLPGGKKHVVPPLPQRDTIATGAPSDGQTPVMEMSVANTLVVRQFIEASISDTISQVQRSARTCTPRQLKELKLGARFIIAWMEGVLMTIDAQLSEATVTTSEPEPKT